MPPKKESNPVLSSEKIQEKLAEILHIAKKRICIRPSRTGVEYSDISSKEKEEAEGLQRIIEDLLCRKMIRCNMVAFYPKTYKISLYKEQIGSLIEENLSGEIPSILYRMIFLQPSEGEESAWVQFLDAEGIDKGGSAKDTAKLLNSIISKKKEYKDIKEGIGKGNSLFSYYENEENKISFIWINNSKHYEEFRIIFLESYEKIYHFRPTDALKTLYANLFEKQKLNLRQEMFLPNVNNTILKELIFTPSEDESSWRGKFEHKLNSQEALKQCQGIILRRAKACHKKIKVDVKKDYIEMSESDYRIWRDIIDSLAGAARHRQQKDVPFSLYITFFGNFYLYLPEGRMASAVLDALNRDLKKPIFQGDYGLEKPVLFIKEKDYNFWLKKKQGKNYRSPVISPEQTAYLLALEKQHYSPIINYEFTVIKKVRKLLQQNMTSELYLNLMRAFSTKIEITEELILEAESLGEEYKGSVREGVRKAARLAMKDKVLDGASSVTIMEDLVTRCHYFIEHIRDIYTCDIATVEQLIKRFMYPYNQKPNIFFNKELEAVIVKVGQYCINLCSSSNFDGLEPDYSFRYQAKGLLAQIFCALSEIIFHYYYMLAATSLKASTQEDATTNQEAFPFKHNWETVDNATNLLVTDGGIGLSIYFAALSMQGNTIVAKSGISKAGGALYVKGPIQLVKGMVVTWFDGKVIMGNVDLGLDQTNYVSIEGYASMNAQVIIANKDKNHPGCAHYANHSTENNAEFKTIYGKNKLPLAKVIIYTGSTIELKEEALEIVVNYGKRAAAHIHGIEDEANYAPQVVSVSSLSPDWAQSFVSTMPVSDSALLKSAPVKRKVELEEEGKTESVNAKRARVSESGIFSIKKSAQTNSHLSQVNKLGK